MKKKTTIIIPTYNEEKNIKKILKILEPKKREIIIVDDNSQDATAMIAKKMGAHVISRPEKMGIGSAIRDGLKHATCEKIILMDADFSHNPHQTKQIEQELEKTSVVFLSRFVKGGGFEQKAHRLIGTKTLNILTKKILRLKTQDNTNGHFGIKKETIKKILKKYEEKKVNPFYTLYQTSIAYACSELGIKIKEIPTTYKNRMAGITKLSSINTGIEQLKMIIKLKITNLKT
ncbi:MAG: glycosyltransferase [Nanoarchaeota archaeon]|nr:glycosyltransferase [Nanoarchaeota archaeon]